MQNELTALRPQLLETSDETERLMIKIEQDTIQVEAKKEIVACDEALANEAAAAAQAIRDDCENDLAEAIPALQSAVTALDTLNANDITVVKTMKNPAPIVKFVVEAVCVMKGVLPERKPGTKFSRFRNLATGYLLAHPLFKFQNNFCYSKNGLWEFDIRNHLLQKNPINLKTKLKTLSLKNSV